jgi:hypothetical protein
LNPTEVFSQIILILFDAIFSDLASRTESAVAEMALDEVRKALLSFEMSRINEICRIIEVNSLRIETVISVLRKIRSVVAVEELFEKGFCMVKGDEVGKVIHGLDLERIVEKREDFGFSGFGEGNVRQNLFVSKTRPNGIPRYTIAVRLEERL